MDAFFGSIPRMGTSSFRTFFNVLCLHRLSFVGMHAVNRPSYASVPSVFFPLLLFFAGT